MRILLNSFLLAAGCLVISGCGGGEETTKHEFHAVKGKVTKGGKAVSGVEVTFHPEADSSLPTSSGMTDENGEYTLISSSGGAGAVAGKHKVTLGVVVSADSMSQMGSGGSSQPQSKVPFAELYKDKVTTPKDATVEAGKENTVNIEL